MDEVQDFSMPSKNRHNQFQQPSIPMSSSYQQSQSQVAPSKSKLDDMLTKLMQKKNCVSIRSALWSFVVLSSCPGLGKSNVMNVMVSG